MNESYSFGNVHVARDYVGPLTVDVTWEDGSTRTVSGITGTLNVYASSTVAGHAGTLAFTRSVTPAGGGSPTNRMAATLQASDTATPGTYYAELLLVEGGVTDVLHGLFVVDGLDVP